MCIQPPGWNQIIDHSTKARPQRKPSAHRDATPLGSQEKNVHRPVLTFRSIALAIATACCLPGCATPKGAPAATERPQPNTSTREHSATPSSPTPATENVSSSLGKAVEQLVPPDYAVRWIDVEPARRNAAVSWKANQEWRAALAQAVASAPGLTADVGPGSRMVLIRQATPRLRPLPTAAAAASGVMPTPKKATELASVAPRAEVDGVVRLRPMAVRAGITPEPVVIRERTPTPVNRWELSERDRTLKLVIERWAQDAGWRAFWELDVDYPIAATASIDGSFEEAVSAVVRSMDHADVPLKAIFYRGNQVLRMVPRGME